METPDHHRDREESHPDDVESTTLPHIATQRRREIFPDEWKKRATETTWTGRAGGKLSRIENTPDSTLRPMSAAQSSSSMRAPSSTIRETSLTNRTPRNSENTTQCEGSSFRIDFGATSTAKKNCRTRSAKQSHKADNQAQTPNSTMRAPVSTEGRTRCENKGSRQSELRTPRTVRTTKQYQKGEDRGKHAREQFHDSDSELSSTGESSSEKEQQTA